MLPMKAIVVATAARNGHIDGGKFVAAFGLGVESAGYEE